MSISEDDMLGALEPLLVQARKSQARRDGAGAWLCQCGAKLTRTDFVRCPGCETEHQADKEKQEEQRRFNAWKTSVLTTGDAALATIPGWNHVQDVGKFNREISDPSLRAIARKWIPSNGNILLVGPSGVGKTSAIAMALRRTRDDLAKAALNRQASFEALKRFGFVWLTASEITRAIQQHRLGSGGESLVVHRAVSAPLLIIDELGPEPTRYSGDLFDIVDRRYSNRAHRPTIATSGLTFSAFVDRYGDAMQRRLTQSGIGRLVDLHSDGEGDA